MNIQQLDEDLPITGGALTLTTSSVGGLLHEFLTSTYGGPLTIAGAKKTVSANAVTVDGTAPLLEVADMPVHAVFTLDSNGNAVANLDWSLPAGWMFSKSFPALPLFVDAQVATPKSSLLDQLDLSKSRYVVSTIAGPDASTGAALAAGLNFVSGITPTGVFGMFETLLGGKGPFTIAGPIVLPQRTVTTPPLPEDEEVWDVTWPVPGIELAVPLKVDLTLDKLRLHELALRIYSPTDQTWLAANTTWSPVLAVSGLIDVASAGISGDASVLISSDAQAAMVACNFSGATVSKLAQLTDLVNGPDLESILPQEIASTLGSIAVERASFGLTGSLSAAAVEYVALEVGLPGAKWTLLSEPGTIAVSDLNATFMVAAPFTAERSTSVSFGGEVALAGASFDVVTEYPGFETSLELAEETTVPLKQIFSTLVPVLPPPPDLSIESLRVGVTPGTGYAFSARMADDPVWTLDLGPASMSIGAVTVDIEDGQGSGANGSFSGTLEFGDGIELSMSYDTPGSFAIRGDFPKVELSQIWAPFDAAGLPLPSGFDVELEQAYALIQEQGTNLTLSAAALVDGLGLVALTAEKTGGAWGFAAGVQLGNGTVSSLPGFGPLAPIESFVGLEELLVVVSSLDETGFSFPDMAKFNAPVLNGHSMPLPAQANGVVRGVNVYAALSAAHNAGLKLLADFLGVRLDGTVGITLSVSAPDPATSSKLFFTVGTNINSDTRLDGTLGVLLQNNAAGAFLAATVKTSIQSQPVTFTVNATVLPTGVLIAGTMEGTIHFAPVTLNNVAIEVGIDEAGVPSLGFAATIDIADFESSIAIFFDSTDPSKSMFAGAVSDVTLLSIAQSIAGQGSVPSPLDQVLAQFGLKGLSAFQMASKAGASLDARDLGAIRAAFAHGGVTLPAADDQIFFVVNTAGSVWHLTDLSQMLHYELKASGGAIDVALEPQIYCAPQATTIGTLSFPQAIRVIAEIDEYLIKTKLQVDISPSTGIAATAILDPITIVSANVFSITGQSATGGPELSLSTYTQSSQSDPRLQPPHFLLTGAVNLLGVAATSIYISVTENGLTFDFHETEGPVQFALNGSVSSAPALAVGGSATIGIDKKFEASLAGVDLGSISVDVSINASISVSASTSGADASVTGTFTFEGLSLSIPTIALDVSGPALTNLADTVWDAVKNAIEAVLSDATQWLNWVKNGVVTGAVTAANAVGNVLAKAYGLTADEIVNKTKQILGYTLDGITQALQGAGVAAEAAANALVSAGYAVADVADAIAKFFTGHVDFSLGHIDTPAGPHADTPLIPHIDTPGAPHVDTPGAPHADLAPVHADFGTHADSGSGFWHWDTSIGHADSNVTPHVDTPIYPHLDTPLYPHIDTPPELHADTQVPPHGDTGTHFDVAAHMDK